MSKKDLFSVDFCDSSPKLMLAVRFPTPILGRIETEAEKHGVSKAEVVRRYVKLGMEVME